MKKIILSTNYNPDYLYYTPLVVWAWRRLGWEPIVFYEGESTAALAYVVDITGIEIAKLSPQEGYRSDTITQISRLYGACVAEGYLMTGDIDMIPLSDYWKFDPNEITIWGHDLTGFTHYPICYIGMPHTRWIEVMGLTTDDYNKLIKRDLDTLPQAKNPDFYKYWFSDQDLITKRINETQFPKRFFHRGQYPNGFATGRVDRGSWSLDHSQFIDCHALRDMYKRSDVGFQNMAKTMRLLERIWPDENFKWFTDYTREFQKLANNG
jgi:hypothetical protein